MFNLFGTLVRMNVFSVSMHRLFKITFFVISDAVAVKAIKFTSFGTIDLTSERCANSSRKLAPLHKKESRNWLYVAEMAHKATLETNVAFINLMLDVIVDYIPHCNLLCSNMAIESMSSLHCLIQTIRLFYLGRHNRHSFS